MTVVLMAVLGLLIGSFLNLVIHRVPRGESVVQPRSRCPGCGRRLAILENVPIVSWVVQCGRCRGCYEQISVRYPAVEILTAAVFVLLALRIGPAPDLPAFLYLGAIGIALAAIDLDVQRLPNAIVLPSYGVALALLGAAAITQSDTGSPARAVLGMAALFGGYFLLAVIVPGGMGFGDVKLAGVLGLYLGWLGWIELAVGAFSGFLLGGVAGLALMAAGRADRKTHLPFGPFMLLGALLAILAARPLAHAYLEVLI
jgi:leader peptidase (prepilin peptidase)/N-methyltransferase